VSGGASDGKRGDYCAVCDNDGGVVVCGRCHRSRPYFSVEPHHIHDQEIAFPCGECGKATQVLSLRCFMCGRYAAGHPRVAN